MKNSNTIFGILLILIFGIIIGFFGVFLSVFADGVFSERLKVILIVMLCYCVLGFAAGLAFVRIKWFAGLILGAPGAILLLLGFIKESNPYYILYLALILLLPCLCAAGGNKLRRSKS